MNLNTMFLSSCCSHLSDQLHLILTLGLTVLCACRACVSYSNNLVQHSTEVTEDLAKCCIKEIEKPLVDRNCGIPTTKLPIQAPQTIQGMYFSFSYVTCC